MLYNINYDHPPIILSTHEMFCALEGLDIKSDKEKFFKKYKYDYKTKTYRLKRCNNKK